MKRVGRLLICIAGALALSVSSRAGTTVTPTPNVPSLNALRSQANQMYRSNLMKRLELMKQQHRYVRQVPPGSAQLPSPRIRQLAKIPQSNNALPLGIGDSVAANNVPAKSDLASGNPYQTIITRNVFGLNPIPPAAAVPQQAGPPPPKITLTGITTIFGPAEALYKVAGVVRDGKPPHDEFYTFTEGEAQDDVEVTKIDVKGGSVTFMNHGIEQVIPLTDGVASSGSAPSAPTFAGQMHRFGQRPIPGGNPAFHPDYSRYRNQKILQNLTGDDQQALIAAQHAQFQQQGNPAANFFPPTHYDGQAGITPPGGGGGQSP